jgi:hypothetical protein
MPQAQLIQNSFNSGEISPLAFGRSDTEPYKHALARCRNMIPSPIGPVTKRPGSRFIAVTADEAYVSKLVGFSYSNVQSYILELANYEIRFFTPALGGGWIQPPTIVFDDARIDTDIYTIGLDGPHYLRDGSGPYNFASTGTLPDPLDTVTDYYIVLAAAGAGAASLAVSLTPGGAAVTLTDTGGADESHSLVPAESIIQSIETPYTAEEAWEADYVPSGDILYITHPNHAPRQLERRAANGFILREVFLKDGPYDKINTIASQTMDPSATPATTQSEPNVFAPADVSLTGDTPANYITIPFHGYKDRQGPVELKSSGTLPAGLALATPYLVQKINDHQIQILAASDPWAVIVITDRGDGVHIIEGRSQDTLVFEADILNTDSPSTDTGRRFRYREGLSEEDFNPKWSWGIIDVVVDARNTSCQVHRGWSDGVHLAEKVFRLGAFYPGNYPAYCAIHEQRLWFAGTATHPNTLWASQIGDFRHFAPDEGIADYDDLERLITDAAAITYTLGAGQVDKFSWLSAVRQLIVGTTGAIWPIQATSLLETITPTNINSRPSATIGSSSVKPIHVSDEIVYLSSNKHKLLAIGFDFERDAFVPQDLSILASHFTEKPFVQLAYAEEPHSVIWGCRDDGLLVGVTYERTQRVLGWSGHEFGGLDAKVKSIAVVPDTINGYDQLWTVVERTINGQPRRYIELLEQPFYTDGKLEDAAFLDCSLVPYEGTPITQVSGLDHLEAETVYAIADGAWIGDLKVIGGTVTLEKAASKIRIGLNYNAYVKTLPLEAAGAPGGTLIDRTKRLVEAWARLHRTNYVQIGKELDSMKVVALRKRSDIAEEPVPLRTNDVGLNVAHGIDIDQSFYIGSDKPVPLDLIGLTGRFEWGAR